MGGKKTVEDSRRFEKDRRDKLNAAFDVLGKLLPDHDPSVTLSKIEILRRAAQYIRDLQSQNDEIVKLGSESALKAESEKLKKRIAQLLLKTKELVDALRSAGVPIPTNKKKSKKKQPAQNASSNQNIIAEKPLNGEATKDDSAIRVVKCGCKKGEKKPLKEINPIATTASSSVASLPMVSIEGTSDQPVINGPNIIALTPSPIINSPIVATRIQSLPIIRNNNPNTIIRPPNPSVIEGSALATNMIALRNNAGPLVSARFSSPVTISSDIVKDIPQNVRKSTVDVVTTTSSSVITTQSVVNTSKLIDLHQNNIISHPIVTPRIQNVPVIEKNILSNLGPGTLILADGRIVNVPPIVPQIVVKPQPAVILMSSTKKKEKLIIPKRREITKTTFANKAPIPAIQTFRLESCPRIRPKKKPKAVKRIDKPKSGEDEEEDTISKKKKLVEVPTSNPMEISVNVISANNSNQLTLQGDASSDTLNKTSYDDVQHTTVDIISININGNDTSSAIADQADEIRNKISISTIQTNINQTQFSKSSEKSSSRVDSGTIPFSARSPEGSEVIPSETENRSGQIADRGNCHTNTSDMVEDQKIAINADTCISTDQETVAQTTLSSPSRSIADCSPPNDSPSNSPDSKSSPSTGQGFIKKVDDSQGIINISDPVTTESLSVLHITKSFDSNLTQQNSVETFCSSSSCATIISNEIISNIPPCISSCSEQESMFLPASEKDFSQIEVAQTECSETSKNKSYCNETGINEALDKINTCSNLEDCNAETAQTLESIAQSSVCQTSKIASPDEVMEQRPQKEDVSAGKEELLIPTIETVSEINKMVSVTLDCISPATENKQSRKLSASSNVDQTLVNNETRGSICSKETENSHSFSDTSLNEPLSRISSFSSVTALSKPSSIDPISLPASKNSHHTDDLNLEAKTPSQIINATSNITNEMVPSSASSSLNICISKSHVSISNIPRGLDSEPDRDPFLFKNVTNMPVTIPNDKSISCNVTTLTSVDSLLSSVFPVYSSPSLNSKTVDPKSTNTFQLKSADDSVNIMGANTGTRDIDIYNSFNQQTYSADIGGKSLYPSNVSFPHNSLPKTPHWNKAQYNKSLYNPNFGTEVSEPLNPKMNNTVNKSKSDSHEKQHELSQVTYFGIQNDPVVTSHGNTFFPNLSSCTSIIPSCVGFNETPSVFSYHNNSSMAPSYSFMPHENISTFSGNPIAPAPNIYADRGVIPNMPNNYTSKTNLRNNERINVGNESTIYSRSSQNLGDNIYPAASSHSNPPPAVSSLSQPISQTIKMTSSEVNSSSTYPISEQSMHIYSNGSQRQTHMPGSIYSVTSGSYNSISQFTSSYSATPSMYNTTSLANSSHTVALSMYNAVTQHGSSHVALPSTYTTTSQTISLPTVSSSAYDTTSQITTSYSVASSVYSMTTLPNSLHKIASSTYNNIAQFTSSHSSSSYNTASLAATSYALTSSGYNSTTQSAMSHSNAGTSHSSISSSILSHTPKTTHSTISQTSSLNPVSSSAYSHIFQPSSSQRMVQSGYTLSQSSSSSHAVISNGYSSAVSQPASSDKVVSNAYSNTLQNNSSHSTTTSIYSYIPQSSSKNYGPNSQINISNTFPKSSQSSNSSSFPVVTQQSSSNIQDTTGFPFLSSNKNIPSAYSNSNSNISQYGTSYQSCTSVPNSSQSVYTNSLHQSYSSSVQSNLSNVDTNTGQSVSYPCSTETSNLPGIFTVLPSTSRIHVGSSFPNTSSTYSSAPLPSMSYAYTTSTQSYASSVVSQYTICSENVPEPFNTDTSPKNKKSLEIGGSNKNNFKVDPNNKTNVENNQPSQVPNKISGIVAPDKGTPLYNDRNKDKSHTALSDSSLIDHQQSKTNPGLYNSDKDPLSESARTSMDSQVKVSRNNVYGVNALEKGLTNPQTSSKSSNSVDPPEKDKEVEKNKLINHNVVSSKGKEDKDNSTETNIPSVKHNLEKNSQNNGKKLEGQNYSNSASNSNNKSAPKDKTKNDNSYSYNHQSSYSIEKHLHGHNVSCNSDSSTNNQLKSYSDLHSSAHDTINNQYNMDSSQRSIGVLTSGTVPQFSQSMPVSSSADLLSKTTFVDTSLRPPEKKDISVQKSYESSGEGSHMNKVGNTSDFLKSKDIERNTFIPIMDDVRLPTDFSTDLFSSLQVPTGGAHSESISPTAAFLLAFPLVSSSRAAENLNENENHDNQTSTPTTILQIGNIDPPSSEFFHPIDFQKGNPKPNDHFDLNSTYLNVNELPEKQSQSGYKRCDKRRDTFPDYSKDMGPTEDKQKSKSAVVTTNSYNQSYNQPLMSCNEYQYCEKDSNQWQQDYSSNNPKESKKTCSRKKEKVTQKGCIHQSYPEYYSYKDKKRKQQNRISVNWMSTPENREQTDYHNKESEAMNNLLCPPSQTLYGGISLDFPSESFSDFSNPKKSNNYSWSPNKSLLPTLDNHLLIPSTLPTLVGDLALGTSTPSETYKSYEAPKIQIQGQHSKKTPEKIDVNKKSNEFSKTQANFFSVSQLVDPKSKKQKLDRNYKRSEKPQKSRNNFNCPKRKEDNCMYYEDRSSFPPNQNQYNEKRHPYKGGSYSAESLIGIQHNEMDLASSFNYQQNTNYFPSEFPPPVESSQQYGYFQQTHFSGFSQEECQDFGFNASQRGLDNNRQKSIGRKEEHFPGAGLLQPQICSTHTKNTNYNVPSSHISTNTTSTLTNFNLSTIFPEMNDQRVGTSAQTSQQMNNSYSNSHNYRNHLS